MIDRSFGGYDLICDVCSCEAEESFDDFNEAIEYKKTAGWKSKKIDGKYWADVCPECAAL